MPHSEDDFIMNMKRLEYSSREKAIIPGKMILLATPGLRSKGFFL